MKLTKEQIKAIRVDVKAAIRHRALSWEAQRRIEMTLERDFDGMDKVCEDFAATTDSDGNLKMSDNDIELFISGCDSEDDDEGGDDDEQG